jgi:hypothetical protein
MKIGQGRENAKSFLTENSDIMDAVTDKVKSFMGLNNEVVETES